MKQVTRSFVRGNKNATPGISWCFPGDENCNNYCNHDHSKPTADAPKYFDTIIWEEIARTINLKLTSKRYYFPTRIKLIP